MPASSQLLGVGQVLCFCVAKSKNLKVWLLQPRLGKISPKHQNYEMKRQGCYLEEPDEVVCDHDHMKSHSKQEESASFCAIQKCGQNSC